MEQHSSQLAPAVVGAGFGSEPTIWLLKEAGCVDGEYLGGRTVPSASPPYCYFPVCVPETGEAVGHLIYQNYES